MKEIDRVAMREGLTDTTEYLDSWNWSDDYERPGTAEEVAAAVIAELETEWIPARADREPDPTS
jgi:hypothetical protein